MENKRIAKEPISDTIARFQDCDPFGHLNNARYIDYFLNVREDHLLECYGIDCFEMQKHTNKNWLVAKTKIAYIFPVSFKEKISVITRVINYDHTSFLLEGVMLDNNRKIVKSIIWMDFKYFDLINAKLTKHSDELMELFEKILVEGVNSENFDKRVKEIIRELNSKRILQKSS